MLHSAKHSPLELKIPSAEELHLDLSILIKETGKLLVKMQGCGIVLWQNTVLQVLMSKCSNLTHVWVKMNRYLPRLLITFDYGSCRVEPCWQSRNREQVSYSAGSSSGMIHTFMFNRATWKSKRFSYIIFHLRTLSKGQNNFVLVHTKQWQSRGKVLLWLDW